MLMYTMMENYVDHNYIIAAKMYDAEEQRIRAMIAEKGVRNCGFTCLKWAKGLTDDVDLTDFILAVRRREFLQSYLQQFKATVDIRNQRVLTGDITIDPIIDAFIYFMHYWGYSQPVISELAGVAQQTVSRKVCEISQVVRKRGQAIEFLNNLNDFNPSAWIIDEDNEKTGNYLTVEQRKLIQHYRDLGYPKARTVRKTGFSPRAVARWYAARDIA